MFPIGIDWAEKHLDYCIENSSGDVILRDRVDNDDDGFNSLLQSFEKEKIDLSEIAVAIESPNQRVVDFLKGCYLVTSFWLVEFQFIR